MVILLLLGFVSHAETNHSIGQREYVYTDVSRNRKIRTYIWYPAEENAKSSAVLDGPFIPMSVSKNSPLDRLSSQFPLILLSHGSGGSAQKLFWLATTLVQNGYIVLAVNHSGNMKGDNSADGMLRVWDRALDLKFVLDQFLSNADFKNKIDTSKIGAAGHSAGGTTALLLGGARFAKENYTSPTPKCSDTDDQYFKQICNELEKIDFKKYSKEIVEKDYSDKRIKAVVALDPGFAKAFQLRSLKSMNALAHIFIADHLREPADEIYSKEFLKLMPQNTEVVPLSVHMSFLSACKPNIPKIKELESLCANNQQKLTIQTEVAKKTLNFFNEALTTK